VGHAKPRTRDRPARHLAVGAYDLWSHVLPSTCTRRSFPFTYQREITFTPTSTSIPTTNNTAARRATSTHLRASPPVSRARLRPRRPADGTMTPNHIDQT
jgi:hypothetical protein